MSNDDNSSVTRTEFTVTDESGQVSSTVVNSASGNVGHLIQAHTVGSVKFGGIEID